MSKIQNVLSDEESMKQIKELADMLSAPQSAENANVNSNISSNQPPPQSSGNNNLGNIDFNSLLSTLSQSMSNSDNTSSNNNSAKPSNNNASSNNNIDFSSILSGLSGMAGNNSNTTQNNSSSGLGIDLSTIMKIQGIMQNIKQDKNAELLIALKPLLNNHRQEKVDKAVKLLKLWAVYSIAKEQGLLNLSGLL